MVPSNIALDRGPGLPREAGFWPRNLQFATMSPIDNGPFHISLCSLVLYLKSYERILLNFLEGGAWPKDRSITLWRRSADHDPDPEFRIQEFLKNSLMNFLYGRNEAQQTADYILVAIPELFNRFFITPPPIGGRGIVFARFLCFFLCFFVSLSARLRENGFTDLHEIFREGVE